MCVALEAVQPRDLEASEIEVRIGATWIEPSDYQEFYGGTASYAEVILH